jgi:hypothetical protein
MSQKQEISPFGNSLGSIRKRGEQYWCDCFVVQFDTNADVMEVPGWMQLDRCGEHHAESYDADASKNSA